MTGREPVDIPAVNATGRRESAHSLWLGGRSDADGHAADE